MSKQLKLFKSENLEFGGNLLLGKRHEQRILSPKCPMHLIMKGDISIGGSLRKYKHQIETEIKRLAKKFDIQTYGHSVQINHIHFNLKISSRENYKKFIKALTGRIAQLTKIKFLWRPYTKLITWGRQFKNLAAYIIQNEEEVVGRRPYKPRKRIHKSMKVKPKFIEKLTDRTEKWSDLLITTD